MGNEEEKGKQNKFSELIQDIVELHRDCEFGLLDVDDDILKNTQVALRGAQYADSFIYHMRTKLYIEYSKEMSKELIKFAYDLANNLAEVDKTFSSINKIRRDIVELEAKFNYSEVDFTKARAVLGKLIEEYNRLVDEESELKSQGSKKLVFVFVPLVIALTIFYTFLLNFAKIEISGIATVLLWIVSIYLGFYILKRIMINISLPGYVKELIKMEDDEST